MTVLPSSMSPNASAVGFARRPVPSVIVSLTTRSAPRFADFASGEFAFWCKNEHKDRPSTYQRYMRSIKALTEFFGKKTLEVIASGLVEKYKLYRSQQPRKNARDGRLVSSAAINRDLATLRILSNFAMRLGKATRNPVKGVKFLP